MCIGVNIKLVIISLFVLTLILGLSGLYVYYESLKPLRLVKNCNTIADVLDKITYLEYNVTDSQGHSYLVKVKNDPEAKTGTIEYFYNGTKNATITYKYSNKLDYLEIRYENGTVKNATGLEAAAYEEAFYTSLMLEYNQTSGSASAKFFPGIAPVYMTCYIGKALNITWDYYADLVKPRKQAFGLVDVSVNYGKTNYKGEEVNVVILQIARRGAIVSKWTVPVYEIALTDMGNVPVAVNLAVSIPQQGGTLDYRFHLVDIQTRG